MSKQYSDPRWPPDVEFPSLFQVVVHATPAGWSDERRIKLVIPEAERAILGPEGKWVGPNGLTYLPVFHPNEVKRGNPDPQIVGYKAERPSEWKIRTPDGRILPQVYKTFRAAKSFVGVKKATAVQPGWYRAKDHDIYRRDVESAVTGGKDDDVEEVEPAAGVPGLPA